VPKKRPGSGRVSEKEKEKRLESGRGKDLGLRALKSKPKAGGRGLASGLKPPCGLNYDKRGVSRPLIWFISFLTLTILPQFDCKGKRKRKFAYFRRV
jgi:hypothetical protein